MERILIAVAVIAAAALVAWWLDRRRPDVPTAVTWPVPVQLDRQDFARPDAPWLVALFSSATCDSCLATRSKVAVLESGEVAVHDVEVGRHKDLHDRYGIEAVPIVVIADSEGVVRASYVGPPSAADLWAVVAELREPGSVPDACDHGLGEGGVGHVG